MVMILGEVSPWKRQKCYNGRDDVIALDDLPEPIISHILSFLPMKYVVATSCLSKSWRFRWKGVTSFDFESRWWPECPNFVNFVNMLMLSELSAIHTFRLRWENLETGSGVPSLTEWLQAAILHKVEVVDVGVFGKEDRCYQALSSGIDLPPQLMISRTLEILKLRGPFVVKVPSQVDVYLPKLILLELNLVHFESEEESLRNIMHGCPVLKSFRFERTDWCSSFPVINWSISSPSLEHLEIYLRNDIFEFMSERGLKGHYKLEIDAPALEKLVLTDQVSHEISIRGGCIKEADLDILCVDSLKQRDYQNSIVQVIQGLSHVKILKLSERTMENLSRATTQLSKRSSLWSPTASFGITKLVVKLHYATRWKCLIDLINCCTALEILEITHLISSCPCQFRIDRRRWRDQIHIRRLTDQNPSSIVPRCPLSNLKRVLYKGRRGLDDEKPMLLFMLNPAIRTKRVELDLRSDSSVETPNFELTFSFV